MQAGAELAIRRYYTHVIPATSDQVMDATLNTSCKSIDWVRGQRAIDLGIATKVESADTDVYGPLGGRR
ncbi:MAG TPA: hypothetical protein VIL19_09890 [Casimicrobiaceae bacterium]